MHPRALHDRQCHVQQQSFCDAALLKSAASLTTKYGFLCLCAVSVGHLCPTLTTHALMCAPRRCKNRSPQYLRKCMVLRNAACRHVCEQEAKERAPPSAGKHISTRIPGIWQQGRPPWIVCNKNGGAGRHLRSHNWDGREDSGGAQGGRQQCQPPLSDEEKTPCEGGHIGVWHKRLMVVWETRQRNRSGY